MRTLISYITACLLIASYARADCTLSENKAEGKVVI
jgi:hypothetical protein